MPQFLCIFLLSLVGLLSGCASNPSHRADPLENFNRGVFAFNDGVDKILLKPVAESYAAITPEPVDKGITNFFSNLNDIIVLANDLLQLKLRQAASDTGRLVLNSTVGLLGFMDVATSLGMPKHEEDFGQTLGYWGIESGPYLVLPFFGPSTLRDTIGRGVDIIFDPRVYYANAAGEESTNFVIGANTIETIDFRSDLSETERILQAAALDHYSYIRDAYLARRQYLVYDGNPPEEESEKEVFDEDELFDS